MTSMRVLALAALAYSGATASAAALVETQRLIVTNGEAGAEYNSAGAMSVSGNFAIVGGSVPNPNREANDGRAYVLKRIGGVWSDASTLLPPNVQTEKGTFGNEHYGASVAIAGRWAIVGAGDSAYVYRRARGGAWLERAVLTKPAGASAFSADRVAISANSRVAAIADVSARVVYVFEGRRFQTVSALSADDLAGAAPGDAFGHSIALSAGHTLMVSAPKSTVTARKQTYAFAGAVYVFERADAWQHTQRLVSDAVGVAGVFGFDVALAGGDRAIVGSAELGAHAEVFERDPASGEWQLKAFLTKMFQVSGTKHLMNAVSVDITSDAAVIRWRNGERNSVDVYERDDATETWEWSREVSGSDTSCAAAFSPGTVAMSDQTQSGVYFVSSRGDGSATDCGHNAIHVFE